MPRVRWLAGWALVALQVVLRGALVVELRHARRVLAPLRAAGLAFAVTGACIALAGTGALGRALHAHSAPVEAATLRTDGAYRLVRPPIYSGLLLCVCGAAVTSGTARAFALLGVFGALLSAKARFEERLLAERFLAYPAYARRTPRFVPRLAPARAPRRRYAGALRTSV